MITNIYVQELIKRQLQKNNDLYNELSLQGAIIFSAWQVLDELIFIHPLWRQVIVFHDNNFLLDFISIVFHNLHKVWLVCGDPSMEFYDNSIVLNLSFNWIYFFLAKTFWILNMKVIYEVFIDGSFWLRGRIINVLTYLWTKRIITTATSIARITNIHHKMIGSTLLPSSVVSRS